MSRRAGNDNAVSAMRDLQHEVRADYDAAKLTRYTRRRHRLGGTGDAHYAIESEFDRIREYTRDMDRNDGMVGPLTDRAVVNQLQTGFRVEPDTGDEGLNVAQKDTFAAWAADCNEADFDGESSFWELAWYAMRSTFIDGDIFAVLTRRGSIQLLEADRCRTPTDAPRDSTVHGVELAGRRKTAYWFTRDPGQKRLTRQQASRVLARDRFGNPQVLHVYNPQTVKRKTQTRGITAFAPVFYRLGMYEDLQFANLVRQQVLSAVALFLERDANYRSGTTRFGTRTSETDPNDDDGDSRTLERIAAGQIIRGAKGEKPHMLAANVPSAEYFQQLKSVLTEIGLNLGLPLVLALMDASETNFSGWRGAFDQAKLGFRNNQEWFVCRFLRHVYAWKLRQWLDEGVFGTAARDNPAFFRHKWGRPAWPYIQPLQDAQANAMKLETGQLSPSGFARENGLDWETHAEEIVRNWRYAIATAKKAAAELNKQFPDDEPVHWRDLLHVRIPQGISLSGPLDSNAGNGGGSNTAPAMAGVDDDDDA